VVSKSSCFLLSNDVNRSSLDLRMFEKTTVDTAQVFLHPMNGVQHLNSVGTTMGVIERKAREKQKLKDLILDAARKLFVRHNLHVLQG